jgi:cell division protease FtsH
MSDNTAQQIDDEVKKLIEKNYQRAEEILRANMEKLHLMADGLIKYETIDAKQIAEIMDGHEPSPPEDWDASKRMDQDKKGEGTSSTTINGKPVDHPAGEH